MDYIETDTPNMKLYKADTKETYEDISPRRGKEIYEDVVSRDAKQQASELADRYNSSYRWSRRKNKLTYPSIRVDEEIVLRALGGILAEKEWESHPGENGFPNGTPGFEETRDFILRKEVGYVLTQHILVDVKPYHPLQDLAKREGRGELEKESDKWKEVYARAFDGMEPYNGCQKYAEELGLEDVEYKGTSERGRYDLTS